MLKLCELFNQINQKRLSDPTSVTEVEVWGALRITDSADTVKRFHRRSN